MPLILRVDPEVPDPDSLERAARILREGGILAYPTETLYGLGVDPFQEEALEALFRLKGRPEGMPISILARDMSMLMKAVGDVSPLSMRIMERFLPGPLTVVLAAGSHLPVRLTGGTGKIGVRISSHPVVRHLFTCLPGPVTTTSANLTGTAPASSAEQIAQTFPEGIGCILDAGPHRGVGSTVVDLTGACPVILREGTISGDAIRSCREIS